MTTKVHTVSEAFTPPIRGNNKFTKKYIAANPGQYPVYSAATTGPLGYIDTFSHEGTALSWTTNGYAGNISVLHGRYSLTADRALVQPLLTQLDLEYCRLALQAKFREAARGRRIDGKKNEYTKLTTDLVRDIEFEIPVLPDGSLDLVKQAALVARERRIVNFQERSRDLSRVLISAVPNISFESASTKSISLTDTSVFQFVRKTTNWGKKDWHSIATGNDSDYPVYSAAKGPVAYVDVVTEKLISASSDQKVVSFAVDGDSSAGGNLVVHTRPFYVSTNRACFTTSDPLIDMDFVYHSLATMKADHGFNFGYKAYDAHLADVMIDFPITGKGAFDLDLQVEAAKRRGRLLFLRDGAIQILGKISSAKVQHEL